MTFGFSKAWEITQRVLRRREEAQGLHFARLLSTHLQSSGLFKKRIDVVGGNVLRHPAAARHNNVR